jgi:hypothetical protein
MRVFIICLLGLIAAPAVAQVELANPLADIRKTCIAEAEASQEVKTADGQTYYTCVGETAKKWYDVSSNERAVHDKNGIFIARYYAETGYCAHQIEDSAGKPTSAYVCEVVVQKSP